LEHVQADARLRHSAGDIMSLFDRSLTV
jgi:hypothetical protein